MGKTVFLDRTGRFSLPPAVPTPGATPEVDPELELKEQLSAANAKLVVLKTTNSALRAGVADLKEKISGLKADLEASHELQLIAQKAAAAAKAALAEAEEVAVAKAEKAAVPVVKEAPKAAPAKAAPKASSKKKAASKPADKE